MTMDKAMTDDWRVTQVAKLAAAFLKGEAEPLETATSIHSTLHWDDAPEDLKGSLLTITGVVSETDDILLGERRQLWHPEVRAKEDQKHDEAQIWAAPIVTDACERIIAATKVR
jgi:hypothetical protein